MSARRKPPKPLPFSPVGLFSADELAGDRASSVAAGGSGSPPLSAAEVARLDSWLLDIARGARGSERAAGGSWRFGSKGAFVLHPDGSFFDFSAGAGGRGGLTLIRHLHLDAEPVAWARAWLGEHEGSGKFSPTEANDDTEADDHADRVALIEAMQGRRGQGFACSRSATRICDTRRWTGGERCHPSRRAGPHPNIIGVGDCLIDDRNASQTFRFVEEEGEN
jgi:hypothetical protein